MKKYNGFQKLDQKISKIIKPISKKKKDNFLILNNLEKNWEKMVGAKYYQFCYPKKVQFNTNNKTVLFIGAYNAAVAFALESQQNYIIEKIASYFGYKIISNIKISQELREMKLIKKGKKLILEPKDEELIAQNIENIKDKNLQEVLEKLGKEIFAKKTD
jgi:hypothetical protein